ncbi:MAG: hypothetical protein C0417_11185 [Chlorobiaceae bacterium]|nr:hypothetical protein [Chlorobiaceae bacterium]
MPSNKKLLIGLAFGSAVGIIDVIPMIFQNLTWDANLSAFSMWVVVGIFIASVNWKMNRILKGIIISLLTFLPCGVLIGWQEPRSLIPIIVVTIILGGFSGHFISKYADKNEK